MEVFSRFLRLLLQGSNLNVDHEVFCESLSWLRQQFELGSKGEEAVIAAVKEKVAAVCAKFPVYAK
jgi:hypothetical protein